MAKITNGTRDLLRKKVLEKSDDKRNAIVGEITKLSDSLDAEADKMKAKAVALIKREFEFFNTKVTRIMENHNLKWGSNYSYNYSVKDIIDDKNDGVSFIKDNAGDKMERVKNSKDPVVKCLDKLRADLVELDAKRSKACEDIELRVALGAKFDEVVDIINNLQF